jgi:hypothetical protein
MRLSVCAEPIRCRGRQFRQVRPTNTNEQDDPTSDARHLSPSRNLWRGTRRQSELGEGKLWLCPTGLQLPGRLTHTLARLPSGAVEHI